MFSRMADSIHLSQLSTLGIKLEWVYFIAVFVAVLMFYKLLTPVVYWLVSFKSIKILSYFIGSLLVIVCAFALQISVSANFIMITPKIVFEGLAAFGGVLFIMRIYHIALLKQKAKALK